MGATATTLVSVYPAGPTVAPLLRRDMHAYLSGLVLHEETSRLVAAAEV